MLNIHRKTERYLAKRGDNDWITVNRQGYIFLHVQKVCESLLIKFSWLSLEFRNINSLKITSIVDIFLVSHLYINAFSFHIWTVVFTYGKQKLDDMTYKKLLVKILKVKITSYFKALKNYCAAFLMISLIFPEFKLGVKYLYHIFCENRLFDNSSIFL